MNRNSSQFSIIICVAGIGFRKLGGWTSQTLVLGDLLLLVIFFFTNIIK